MGDLIPSAKLRGGKRSGFYREETGQEEVHKYF